MKPNNSRPPLFTPEPLGSAIPTHKADTDPAQGSSDNTHDGRNGSEVPHSLRASAVVRIGLVDGFVFTRGCLIEALTAPEHRFVVIAVETVADLVSSGPSEIDVILYYQHEQNEARASDISWHTAVREQMGDVPIIVLSDATTALEPQTVRAALKHGVRGFISTRTFEMRTVSAAIHFVAAGGVFAPVDLLLTDGVQPPAHDRSEAAPPDGFLTPRQATVLSLLRQGKANKIIAYELGMSESTVKVHIRNIMRKMGATNRTQAVYKLQQLSFDGTTEVCAGRC